MEHLANGDRTAMRTMGPSNQQWKKAKKEIERLYITNFKTLSETRAEMEKIGFFASEKSYKEQLKKWKMGKYATRKDYLAYAKLYQLRYTDSGKPEIYVRIHHKIYRFQDLRRYLNNHGEQEETFFNEAMSSLVTIPPYIHVCNADGSLPVLSLGELAPMVQENSRITSPRNDSKAIGGSQAMESTFAVAEPQQPPEHNWQALQPSHSQFTTTSPNAQTVDAINPNTSLLQFEGLDDATFLNHLSDLSSFQVVAAGDDSAMRQNIGGAPQDRTEYGTPLNRIPTSDHPKLTTLASDDHLPQSAYVAACMMAAVLGEAGRRDAMIDCLERASRSFQRMCQFHSPAILTTASIVLTWLLVHAQRRLARKVMAASFGAATEALGPNNPVSVLLEWMAAAAARDQLKACRIDCKELRDVWQGFYQTLGESHGHTIVARYCLCFQLILADKAFSEAEQFLQQLAVVSEKVFGLSFVLTINILATLSRAQLRQDKYLLALETIDRSLSAAPLGLNHPHRLELLLRKALILGKLGRWDESEEYYWIVVKGRIATLGWQHKETIAAHNSLVWVLQNRTGNWEARKDDVQRLLVDPQVGVEDYESWWRRVVEANRAPTSDGQGSGDEDE